MIEFDWMIFCWIYASLTVGNVLREKCRDKPNPWLLMWYGSSGTLALLYLLIRTISEAAK